MLKRIIPIIALLFVSCCHPNDRLVYVCNGPCYDGPTSTRNVGECRDGIAECDDGGDIIKCSGETLPQPENNCTGKDLACTGTIDSEVPSVPCYTGQSGTENVGACKGGNTACVDGKSVCQGETTPQLPTDCSNPELSCGITDFGDGQYCYTGAQGTAGIGPCHPGEWQCQNNQEVCVGETTPAPNPICGQDVQCTGQPYYNTIAPMDIVFIFDRSNSTAEDCMCSEFPITIQSAMDIGDLIKSKNSNTDFGIVNMPDNTDSVAIENGYPAYFNSSVLTDLTTVDAFENYLNGENLVTYNMSTPYESTNNLDVMDNVAKGTFKFSWRPNMPHIVIIFSADEPDDYNTYGVNEVATDCQNNNMICVLIVSNNKANTSWNVAPYLEPNFKVFDLSNDSQAMANDIEQLFTKGCN
ncbi:MAG: VWA domain-containing protein [Elusimicrobia bacterium]|nr:VWA domain-containing protein [Elusimicrobiota bacterium]